MSAEGVGRGVAAQLRRWFAPGRLCGQTNAHGQTCDRPKGHDGIHGDWAYIGLGKVAFRLRRRIGLTKH